jgi:hypothetical protein
LTPEDRHSQPSPFTFTSALSVVNVTPGYHIISLPEVSLSKTLTVTLSPGRDHAVAVVLEDLGFGNRERSQVLARRLDETTGAARVPERVGDLLHPRCHPSPLRPSRRRERRRCRPSSRRRCHRSS